MGNTLPLKALTASALVLTLAGCGASQVSSSSGKTATAAPVVIALPVETSPNWFFPVFSDSTFSATNI